MLTPSIFTENLFDDLFEDFPFNQLDTIDRKLYGKHYGREMLTDVKEHEGHYEVNIDLPGFKKEDIKAELKNGYLTITATKGHDEDKKDSEGKIIRQERYAGTMQRSFYIGNQIQPEQIKAKYQDGVLSLELPKQQPKQIEQQKTVAIE